MAVPVKVPQLHESVAEATLLEWKYNVGSRVKIDEILVEIETDKVVLEVPSPASGWLTRIKVASGGAVVSDQEIAEISATAPLSPTAPVFQSAAAPVTQPTQGAGRVFISYRREDSMDISDRLYDELVRVLGQEVVFKDVDSLPLGMDFRQHLRKELESCSVVIAVIGKTWLTTSDEAGSRRLESETDFVRMELELALSRSIPLIPLLVHGASMPTTEQLPQSLKDLAFRHGTNIQSGPLFRGSTETLIRALRSYLS